MPGFIGALVAILIIYYLIKRSSDKEAKQYVEENSAPREAENIENVDPFSEIIVDFVFLRKRGSDLMGSFPNITIDSKEKYKLINDELTLKLNPKFHLHFGLPYMRGEVYRINQSYNLRSGQRYRISFKPVIFVTSKPKVKIEELGSI
jgi:hypothetical protein